MNRLDKVKVLYFEDPAGIQGHLLTGVYTQGGKIKIRLKGIQNKEEVKNFIGKEFFLPESQKILLPKDCYFIDDLIGLEVFDQHAEFRGILSEVLEMGGNDVYVVQEKNKEILIPAVREFIKKVDLKNRKMLVSLWDGM
jgi:16S rRNA processing protein RimM